MSKLEPGIALAAKGRVEEAVAHLQEARRLHPNDPAVEQKLRSLKGF